MLRFHINLATNPFVNYRKYYLLGALLLLAGLSWSVFSVRGYVTLRRDNRAVSADLDSKQKELAGLIQRESELKAALEEPQFLDAIERITFDNALIQRKTFPWTEFFQDLETVIPYNVQVTQIRQKPGGKGIDLEMVFMGRSTADALNFLRNLTNSRKFRDIIVNQEGTFREATTHRVSNDIEVILHMRYEP